MIGRLVESEDFVSIQQPYRTFIELSFGLTQNLRHVSGSSLPSGQSFKPSHCQYIGIHFSVESQRNCAEEHIGTHLNTIVFEIAMLFKVIFAVMSFIVIIIYVTCAYFLVTQISEQF